MTIVWPLCLLCFHFWIGVAAGAKNVCIASAWLSKADGSFVEKSNWVKKIVPTPKSVVVMDAGDVAIKDEAKGGDFMVVGGVFSVTGEIVVTGLADCSGSKCPSTGTKVPTFDIAVKKMCDLEKPTTKPTTTTTTTKKIGSQCKVVKSASLKLKQLATGAYKDSGSVFFKKKCSEKGPVGTATVKVKTDVGGSYRLEFKALSSNPKADGTNDDFAIGLVQLDGKDMEYTAKSARTDVVLHFVAAKAETTLTFTEKTKQCISILEQVTLTECKKAKGGCQKSCQGFSCDYWAKEEDYTCAVLQKDYGCNCNDCECPKDKEICAADKCKIKNVEKSCDEFVKLGHSCETLKKEYGCTCNLCECNAPTTTTRRKTTTTSTTTTTTTTPREETTTTSTTTSTTSTTISGCTNKQACNYNKAALSDDGSCKLPKKCFNCKGECQCKKDVCGVCGGKGPGSDMAKCGSMKGVQVKWIGDGTCDDAHNNCHCGWDKGDCCGSKNAKTGKTNDYKFCDKCKCLDPDYEEVIPQGDCGNCGGKCAKPSFKGDKYCDDNNNNCGCNWDGGDCCGPANNYNFCKDCKCKDCKYEGESDECTKQIKGKCGTAKWKGDKNCDDDNNNAGCDWDGGDCCGPSNSYDYCDKCKCLDCTYETKGDKCVKAIKGACGAKAYVGDKFCDDDNNNAGCNWDKGDCCGTKNNYKFCKKCACRDCTYEAKGDACVKAMKKGCGAPKWKGDGNCDDNNNNAGCNWDGGDCCGAKNYKYCKACKCLDCTYVKKGDSCIPDFKKACSAPKFKGDGFCDDNNNFGGCNWDGGDCCGDKANIKYCKLCECLDCTKAKKKDCPGKSKGCQSPKYKKDGNCDDENNNCKCDWDGGDCCAKSNNGVVKTKYCKVHMVRSFLAV